jgi:hypothetical protein
MKQIRDESNGEMNQDNTIIPTFLQPISEADTAARPDPIRAPITACVPLIGMPNIEEKSIKLKADRVVPSIILS